VIGRNELSFLGYDDEVDPQFGKGGAALPVMIFPARSKNFYFAASTGREYDGFWDHLWRQAEAALQSAARIVICGYGLNPVDERARKLLLNAPKKDAEILVSSGRDTEHIVNEYRSAGYASATAAQEILFQDWVQGTASSVAGAR
jgi:hypothetical protein